MEKGEFDYIFLIVGIVVGVLIIVVSMYRLCCYENKSSQLKRPLLRKIYK